MSANINNKKGQILIKRYKYKILVIYAYTCVHIYKCVPIYFCTFLYNLIYTEENNNLDNNKKLWRVF